MIEVNAYIFFKDNCAEAMRFYEKTLGGKLRLLSAKEMPGSNVPPEMGDGIMHVDDREQRGGAPLGKL
jgi:PhnB protein